MATVSKESPTEVSGPKAFQSKARAANVKPVTRSSRDTKVRLQYLTSDLLPGIVKSFQITSDCMNREKRTNVRLAPGELETLHDVRRRLKEFSLDINGFKYVHAPTSLTETSSQPKIEAVYLEEMEQLLRHEVEGCDEILFYDARVRQAGEEELTVEGLSYEPFAGQVHTDHNEYRSGFDRYYLSEHHQDDVILFKNYDSDHSVAAPICLHTAFDLPPGDIRPGASKGESIEVQALIFTHPANENESSEYALQTRSAPVPQPLAPRLEQGDLQPIDDEDCCSPMDSVREEIIEAKEAKDAELLLSKHKIRALEKTCDLLVAERSKSKSDAEHAQKQVAVQNAYIESLQCQVKQYQDQLTRTPEQLVREVMELSAQLADANIREATRLKSEHDGVEWLEHAYGSGGEIIALRQQVEAYKREAAMWKAEVLGKAQANVGQCWQSCANGARQVQ